MNKAVELFTAVPKLHNCAQAVVCGFDREDLNEEMKLCGGGKAPGGLCGALFGALQLTPEEKYAGIKTEFIRLCQAETCREIKRAGTPCIECVKIAASLVEKAKDQQ